MLKRISNSARRILWKRISRTKLRPEKEEIRLLTVHPGSFDDDLVCDLAVASLQTDPLPEFETISYAWGDASKRAVITLNGYEVRVPASSAAAVRRMRLVSRPRVLWIDAICINQLDLDEKMDQVANMGKVYSSGIGNLVYLGEDSTGNAAAEVAVLRALVERVNEAAHLLSDEDKQVFEQGYQVECWRFTDLISNSDVEKLITLVSAPFFSRLWVVQEVTLGSSNTCHWGELTFPLNYLILVAHVWINSANLSNHGQLLVDTKPLFAASTLRRISSAHSSRNLSGHSVYWYDMHILGNELLVSDPRDYVYALLGLKQQRSDGKQSSLIRPDYCKPVRQVFRDATRCSLESEGDYILVNIDHRDEPEIMAIDKPSWAVIWGREERYSVQFGNVGGPWNSFEVRACGDPNVLRLKGHLLEKVIWSRDTGSISDPAQPEEWKRVTRIAEDVLVTTGQCSCEVAIRRLLSSAFICGHDFFKQHRGKVTPEDALSVDEDTFQGLLGGELFRGRNRSIFTTSDNYIGSGPRLTQNGDRLFIAQGGFYVHIVRPAGDHFLLVGPAYVADLWSGEVLEKGIETRIIDIR